MNGTPNNPTKTDGNHPQHCRHAVEEPMSPPPSNATTTKKPRKNHKTDDETLRPCTIPPEYLNRFGLHSNSDMQRLRHNRTQQRSYQLLHHVSPADAARILCDLSGSAVPAVGSSTNRCFFAYHPRQPEEGAPEYSVEAVYPSTGLNKCEHSAALQCLRELAVQFRPCDCCHALRPADALQPPRNARALIPHRVQLTPGTSFLGVKLCSQCLHVKAASKKNDLVVCPFSTANNIQLPAYAPDCPLQQLSFIELTMIRLVQPFISLVILAPRQVPGHHDQRESPAITTTSPVVGQHACRGQVIQIASSPSVVLEQLLPLPPQTSVVLVRLAKPKGGTTRYMCADLQRIFRALLWLKQNNLLYHDVTLRSPGCPTLNKAVVNWNQQAGVAPTEEEEPASVVRHPPASEQPVTENSSEVSSREELEELSQVAYLDLSQPLPERRTIAPITGNLVSFSTEESEPAAFPHLFPYGDGHYSAHRLVPLSLHQYAYVRLTNADRRFSADPSYIFYLLNRLNQHHVYSTKAYLQQQLIPGHLVAEQQRHTREAAEEMMAPSTEPTAAVPTAPTTAAEARSLMDLEGTRLGASFLVNTVHRTLGRAIRGSLYYWQACGYHLRAMVHCLGPPTVFFTIRSNDEHSLPFFHALDPQRFRTQEDVDRVPRSERIEMINSAPTLAVEIHQHRVHAILRYWRSAARPLGGAIVTDHFIRGEFQDKGSAHTHGVLWLIGIPDVKANVEGFLEWVDRTICGCIPPDKNDADLVVKFQSHHHTFTCKRSPTNTSAATTTASHHSVGDAAMTPTPVLSAHVIGEGAILTAPTGTDHAARQSQRYWAQQHEANKCRFSFPREVSQQTHFRTGLELQQRQHGPSIILHRSEADQYINNYHLPTLRLLQCNMDMQAIDPRNAWAVASYITAYVAKSETNEVAFVQNALRTLPPTATDSQLINKIANSILSYQQVCKQMAVYLCLSIKLYESSRGTIFIPCPLPWQKSKITLPRAILDQLPEDSTNIWAKQLHEHYCDRPKEHSQLRSLTKLQFASWFQRAASTSHQRCGIDINECVEADVDEVDEEKEEEEDALVEGNTVNEEAQAQHLSRTCASSTSSSSSCSRSSWPPPGWIVNPQWGENVFREPPLVRVSQTRFPQPRIRCPHTGAEFVMRKTAKVVRFVSSDAQPVATRYTYLSLLVPFADEYTDLLNVGSLSELMENYSTELSRVQLVNEAFQRNADTIEQNLHQLPTEYALRIEHELRLRHALGNTTAAFGIGESAPMEWSGTSASDEDTNQACIRQRAPAGPIGDAEACLPVEERYIGYVSPTLNNEEEISQPPHQQHQQQRRTTSQQTLLQPPLPSSSLATTATETFATLFARLNPDQQTLIRPFENYLRNRLAYEQALAQWKQDYAAAQALPARTSHLPSKPRMPKPPHVFLTGAAGTGKSYALRCLCQLFAECRPGLESVMLCTTTGVAATNISGQTVHRALRLPVHPAGSLAMLLHPTPLGPEPLQRAREMFANVWLLVIDETSMLSARDLRLVHERLNQICALWRNDDGIAPHEMVFGHMAILLCGDPMQLPPVRGKPIYRHDTPELFFGTNNHLFRSLFHPCELKRSERQKGDIRFAEMLMRFREGVQTEDDVKLLRTRCIDSAIAPDAESAAELKKQLGTRDWRDATWLLPLREEVKLFNIDKTLALAASKRQPLYVIRAADKDIHGNDWNWRAEEQQAGIPRCPASRGDAVADYYDQENAAVAPTPNATNNHVIETNPLAQHSSSLLLSNTRPPISRHRTHEHSSADHRWQFVLNPKDPDHCGGLAPELYLTLGSEVMLRHNLDVQDGLYNGARGIVTRIEWPSGQPPPLPPAAAAGHHQHSRAVRVITTSLVPSAVYVCFHDDPCLELDDSRRLPGANTFSNGVGRSRPHTNIDGMRCLRIESRTASFNIEPRVALAGAGSSSESKRFRTQLPLLEAFALTIHKAQSLTLRKAVVDLSHQSLFQVAQGMAYVAISRVRCLEDLILLGLDETQLHPSPDALQELHRIRSLPPPSEANNWATDLIPDQI